MEKRKKQKRASRLGGGSSSASSVHANAPYWEWCESYLSLVKDRC